MKINLDRFGLKNVSVDPDTLFTFPAGILGFESHKTFKFFHEESKKSLYWLQSVEVSSIAFPIVMPETINLEYEIELSDADCKLIDLKDAQDVAVVVIVYKDDTDGGKISANTHSPVILNMKSRKGMQKILKEVDQKLFYRAK